MNEARPAHIIVVGNEKGGSGKTTTTMHLIVGLLKFGFQVGSIDIDSRQRSLSRYIENRRQTILKQGVSLPLPYHIVVNRSPFNLMEDAENDEKERFSQALQRVFYNNDFVVVDSPGSDTYLSRLAHSYADTVITPINDSFVDMDVLANVDGQTMEIIQPSIYSQMLWEQKLSRAKRDGGSIDWIVMRNRLTALDAKNKRHVADVLDKLSRRIGFRTAAGFSERVIFRELFLQGLTVLDVMDADVNVSMSHLAARQEVRSLLKTLNIGRINEKLEEEKKSAKAAHGADEAKPLAAPAAPAPAAKEEAPAAAPAEKTAPVKENASPLPSTVVETAAPVEGQDRVVA